jgi:radical SAM protein with 4Fe4S-binding SPASM domain
LIAGAKRGALYDLKSGKVYSINQGALQLLLACKEDAVNKLLNVNSPENKQYLNFLDNLTSKELGSFYYADPGETSQRSLPEQPAKLEFLWLELTSACNNKCLHCYTSSSPSPQDTDCVTHERWLSLISEARQAGATAIQLIGGEPLLYPNWRELALKAHSEGYELIEIFTNATLIDDSCIEFFEKYNINIATTIYANNAEVHDQVTLHPGSFNKTITAVRKLVTANIPLRIASIIMKANEQEADNIMKLCAELGVTVTPPDVVRPTGRGDDKDLLPSSYSKPPLKPPFYTNEYLFTLSQKYHSCLMGKLAVTASGDVIPCIFARNQQCGNILTSSLQEILNGQKLQQCWYTTKDMVEKCKDCEYRYACTDCRPLAQGSDSAKRWLACSVGCSYNPYTGIWEDANPKTAECILKNKEEK